MTPDQRADRVLPAAAALICAVADHDPDEVAKALAKVTDWQALAVVLAAHVPADAVLTGTSPDFTHDALAEQILTTTAARFHVTIEQIVSAARHREVTDARAVAMAAMRQVGLSSVFIGRVVSKDHTTVLYAASRVGENARLRKVANEIAALTGAVDSIAEEAA